MWIVDLSKLSIATMLWLGSVLANGAASQTLDLADYFPSLQPGNTWSYIGDASIGAPLNQAFFDQTVTLTVGTPANGGTPLQRTSSIGIDDGDSRTFGLSGNGLILYRSDLSLTTAEFEVPTSPVVLAPASVTVGQSYPFSFSYNGQEPGEGDFWSGSTNGSIQLAGFENVTVPAGTFNTLKLVWSTTWSEPGHSGGTTETWWLAKGIGIIRLESNETSSYPDEPTIQFDADLVATDLLVLGDTDGDGDIDDADLGTAFANYNGAAGSGKVFQDGDTDGDGDVDDADLGTLFSGYTGALTASSVPEPASGLALSLAVVLALRRRRG